MLKRRARETPGTSSTSSGAASCDLSTLFPAVAEFLSQSKWEDGAERVSGTLNLSHEEGVWKGALNDRDQGLYVFVSGKTLTELLGRLDEGIREDNLEWRKSKPWEAGSKRRK